MQDLDRVTLSKDADVRVLDNNFLNVKNAVDAVEDSISDESARATQKENAISANVQQNANDIAIHTQQINDLQENLADYIGAFDNKADLDAYSGTLSNNDWAVVLDDETHSNQCWRYIYRESTTSWEPQFMVNEKPLTQAQLNAINSGIDSTKVAQIATNTSDIANKQDALVSGTNIKTINNKSILGSGNIDIQGGGGGRGIAEITYSELTTLVNNSQLVAGTKYRITDYITTVAGYNNFYVTNNLAKSAGHQFDVIVEALSTNKLSSKAKAIQHTGDTYFANQKLDAWELKYDINNDTNKYTWADSTNGKGVIYYMKDERNNESCFDFKNVLFRRFKVSKSGVDDAWCGTESGPSGYTDPGVDSPDSQWFYLFTELDYQTVNITDKSLQSYCYNNKIATNSVQSSSNYQPQFNNFVIGTNVYTPVSNNIFIPGVYASLDGTVGIGSTNQITDNIFIDSSFQGFAMSFRGNTFINSQYLAYNYSAFEENSVIASSIQGGQAYIDAQLSTVTIYNSQISLLTYSSESRHFNLYACSFNGCSISDYTSNVPEGNVQVQYKNYTYNSDKNYLIENGNENCRIRITISSSEVIDFNWNKFVPDFNPSEDINIVGWFNKYIIGQTYTLSLSIPVMNYRSGSSKPAMLYCYNDTERTIMLIDLLTGGRTAIEKSIPLSITCAPLEK